jgi:hypothetical protein
MRSLDLHAYTRRFCGYTDPSEMTQDELKTVLDVAAERRRLLDNCVRELMADPEFVAELLNDFQAELIPAFIESMRPTGDPTAFRAEATRIVMTVAERRIPVGSVTEDDI